MIFDSYDKVIKTNIEDTLKEYIDPIEEPLNQFYVAQVRDVNDPDKMGKIKVFIYGVHDDNETNLPYVPSLISNGHSLVLPEVDDYVLVSFRNGNIMDPVYLGVFQKSGTWNGVSPHEGEDVIFTNRDSFGTVELKRIKEEYKESVIKGNEQVIEDKLYNNYNLKVKSIADISEFDIVSNRARLMVSDSTGALKQTIDTNKDKTVVSNTLYPITQPVVLENKLKTFWQLIFKIFMDVNWGLITAHMHPGQMCVVGPVTPAPGVPAPIANTPSINNVKSDCLDAGTNIPMGT